MQHDVRRLDRLISDISDASRLDAELARGEAGPVDVAALLRAVVSMSAGFAAQQRGWDRAVDSLAPRPPRRRGLLRAGPRFAPGAGRDKPDRQRLFVFRTGRERTRRPRQERDRDRRRSARGKGGHHGGRRRSRHPPACAGADIRALLHRSPKPGVRAEFRPRVVDFATDCRGARRADLGGEPARGSERGQGRRIRRRRRHREPRAHGAGARFVVELPAFVP